jgi:hypothetical protein
VDGNDNESIGFEMDAVRRRIRTLFSVGTTVCRTHEGRCPLLGRDANGSVGSKAEIQGGTMTALEQKLSELTGLEHPILNEDLLELAQARGYEGSTLGEKEIMEGLSTPRITAEAREALTLWSDIGVESMKKKIMREVNEFSRRGNCPVT